MSAIGAFRVDDYGVRPLMVSPTCKQDSVEDCANLIALHLRCWKEAKGGKKNKERYGVCRQMATRLVELL